jgi:hypothetical protein
MVWTGFIRHRKGINFELSQHGSGPLFPYNVGKFFSNCANRQGMSKNMEIPLSFQSKVVTIYTTFLNINRDLCS